MAITIEQLADELGVGARRVQRWVDRRLGYSIVTKPSTKLPPAVVVEVRDHFRYGKASIPARADTSIRAIAFGCPSCHRKTHASPVTGVCYSHNVPDSKPVRVCPVSGTQVVDPHPGADRLPPLPLTPPRPQGHHDDVSPSIYPVNEGRPWREIPAGLPGLGQHRNGR